MHTWYRTSLYCGLIPLCLGIAIYIAWYVTGKHWLETAGLLNIVLGVCLFCIGILSLVIYIYKAYKLNVRGYLRKAVLPLFILVINFPIAYMAVSSAEPSKSVCTLKVENNSAMQMMDFRLTERDKVYKIPPIPAHSKLEQKFNFKYEGSVYYSFQLDGKKQQGVVFGYVTSGISITSTLVVSETGIVTVEDIINGNKEL